jgi:flagellin
VNNADFNGSNLLTNAAPNLTSLANADGTAVITVVAEDLSVQASAGSIITLTTTDTIGTVTTATNMIATVKTSIDNVSAALARLGTGSKALDSHLTFVGKLQDALDTGVGNLVDADLAKESAKFQALQTKQQLGVQALSIANQSTQTLLGLFR